MLTILIVLLVLALLVGGFGYSRRATWGSYGYGIPGVIVLLLVILLVLYLVGVI